MAPQVKGGTRYPQHLNRKPAGFPAGYQNASSQDAAGLQTRVTPGSGAQQAL